ncbi:hypothetical protein BN946_scf184982.g8 [Trametes cinnabarina]|uniref:Uncharacterized protein n=1 Tax=Pycnoporus cinnabarinus TaxID=5643 RepID=A0A060SWD3_PYCCI|nr:hypothetical protein BN946_scf184982.g8 [Trametes cinnabarina]
MEDDIAFTTTVWGAPTDSVPPLAVKPPAFTASPGPSTQDDFDDFDNFRTPAETISGSGDDGEDDFGDFGDTEQMPVTRSGFSSFGAATYEEPEVIGGPSYTADWKPLHTSPLPSRDALQEQVDGILGPLWAHDDASRITDEEIREVGGLSQTLITPERYSCSVA